MSKLHAKLRDISAAIEAGDEMLTAYFDRQTNSIVQITQEDVDAAEDDDAAERAPEWQKDSIELAREIQADEEGRFLELPGKFEAHEWKMMERFIGTVKDPDATDRLDAAIHGKGAFRMFKDAAARLGLLDDWYAFRNERYVDMAREWCRDHEIEIEDEA